MTENNLSLFKLLKTEVTSKFLENYSAPDVMKEWSGSDITVFQEDLVNKVNARISEKWFYTYFKNQPSKLPRIDILNLLSKYAGYQNWNDFKSKHEKSAIPIKKKFSPLIVVISLAVVILIGSVLFFNRKNHFEFCFYDEDKSVPIVETAIEIEIINKNESPTYLKTDDSGCFKFETLEEQLIFVVQSPNYKSDTIVRTYRNNKNDRINLKTDYHALMLQYFSSNNKNEWEKYKSLLEDIIDEEIVAYELFTNSKGVEVYSKDKLIRKLTIPTTELRRIKIIDKKMKNGKIVNLKFIIQ